MRLCDVGGFGLDFFLSPNAGSSLDLVERLVHTPTGCLVPGNTGVQAVALHLVADIETIMESIIRSGTLEKSAGQVTQVGSPPD